MTPGSASRHCPACLLANPPAPAACSRCGASLTGALGPGSLIGGRYRFVRELGSGGMGVVFEVHDITLDETVALKLLRTDLLGAAAARLRSEIKLARRVAHRNVCRIFEYGEDGPARFIVMERVEGETLRQRLKRAALRPEEAARLVAQAAEGLGAIHEAGIVHRDVKTPNLMLTASDVVKVMDFGIAKTMDAAEGVTQTGMLVGTPEYMSPEQAAGRPLDGRSDLYSLGIVLYELLASDVPFRGDTPVATLWKHLNELPSFDTPAAQRIPLPLQPIVRRLLAKSPDDRPATAAQVAADLRAAADVIEAQRGASTAATLATHTAGLTPPTAITPSLVTPPDDPRARVGTRSSHTLALAALGGLGLMVAVYCIGHTSGQRQRREAAQAPLGPGSPTALPQPAATPNTTPPAPPPSLAPTTLVPTRAPVPTTIVPTRPPPSTLPPTTTAPASPIAPPPAIPEDRPPDTDVMVRALASLEQGSLEQARRELDAVLARKDALRLPVARAKRGGLDRWTLTIQPGKTVTRPGGGLSVYANSVSLVDQRGRNAATAMMRDLVIEGTGRGQPRPDEGDPSSGAYLRLRFGRDSHTLYFWPTVARCRQARRADSNEALLQCDARGLAQQEFVASYAAEAIRAIVRTLQR
jgi:eukaryotic-like serine/threonine-protein kinase